MISPNYFNWPGKVWVFSDPHFGDKGILKYERTEFENPEQHDDFLIKKINSTLGEHDTLVCLGDLGHCWKDSIVRIKKCARKILVMGNHDKLNKTEYKKYFDEVYPGPLFVNKFTILSHEPIPVSDHFLNIHGHLHCSYLDDEHHINVSFKMAGYKLFPLDESYNITSNFPRIRSKFLQEWYADKYIFTDNRKDCIMYTDTMHIIPMEKINQLVKIIGNYDFGLTKEEYEQLKEFYSNRRFKQEIKPNITTKDENIIAAKELIKTWRENEV